MSTWILIVSWAVAAGSDEVSSHRDVYRRHAIAMQEFNNVEACKFASVEVQKIALRTRVVCVPKGDVK